MLNRIIYDILFKNETGFHNNITENKQMTAVKLDNVKFQYATYGSKPEKVLDGISLTIEEGEFVALVGHNGSGKSTLAKLLNVLLSPTEGKIEVFGMDTLDESLIFEIRKRVGMVFQNPDNQMIASIVEDDVAFGPENLGVPREEIVKRVDWALEKVGMSEMRRSTPFKMSGGQKQRIAIAGVLAVKPDIMVLDESTAMLDPKGRREVLDVAKKLNKEEGMTVILITHFMDEALEADRIIVMDDGKTILDGSPEEVFKESEKLKSVGLGVPRAKDVAERLRERGLPIDADILREEELIDRLCQLL